MDISIDAVDLDHFIFHTGKAFEQADAKGRDSAISYASIFESAVGDFF